MMNVQVTTLKMILCENWKMKLVEKDPSEEMQLGVEVAVNLFVWIGKITEGKHWCQMLPFLHFPFFDVLLLVQHTRE